MRYPASDKILNEIKQRIVETANPLKIILFGSAARGELGPNSDLDILVVIPSGIHWRVTARSIYRNLIGVGFAVDIVGVNEEDIERYKDNIGMVIKPALDRGRIIYAKWKKDPESPTIYLFVLFTILQNFSQAWSRTELTCRNKYERQQRCPIMQ